MKKLFFAASAAFLFSLGTMAQQQGSSNGNGNQNGTGNGGNGNHYGWGQGGHNDGGSDGGNGGGYNGGIDGEGCGNCWRDVYEECTVPVKVSIRDIVQISCHDCGHIYKCINTLDAYENETVLGNASFNVFSTKPYDVQIGVDDTKWDNTSAIFNPGSTINYGSGASAMELRARLLSIPPGTLPLNGFGPVVATALAPMTSNSVTQTFTGGTQLYNEAPASTSSSTTVEFRLSPVPMNAPEGDYEINVLFVATID